MNTYVIYAIITLSLSFAAKLHPLFQDSNYHLFFTFFMFFNCFVIERYFKAIKKILLINSVLYLILLLVFYGTNFSVNRMGFFPNADDSFFYSQGLNLFSDEYSYSSPFDIILYVLIRFGANDALAASAYNWSLSTVLLGLIYKLSKIINSNFNKYFLYFLSLNYFFIESSILLFRDITGLTLLICALILVSLNQRKFIVFSFLAMQIRVMTGAFAIIYYLLSSTGILTTKYKGRSVVILFFFILAYTFYAYIPLAFINYISAETEISGSLSDINQQRVEMLSDLSSSDITSKLMNLGLLGIPFVLLINILTPLRFVELFSDISYTFRLNDNIINLTAYNILNYKGVLSIIHISSLCFWLLPFFNGFYNLIKSKKSYIVYYFIIALFIVSYVSFQPRHKLHFLLLIPIICSFTKLKTKNIIIIGLVSNFFILSLYILTTIVS